MKTQPQPNDLLQRSVLPIPDRRPVTLTTYDAKDPDTKFPPITQLRPPTGAPNVLVILLDDVGFGASSAFGGPCQTPNAEKLASGLPKDFEGSGAECFRWCVQLSRQWPHDWRFCSGRLSRGLRLVRRDDFHRQSTGKGLPEEPGTKQRADCSSDDGLQPR